MLFRSQYLFTAIDRFDEHPDKIRAVKNKSFKYIRNYNINKPHAIPVGYRTQMNLMKHLNKLNESNRLLPEQKLWFKVPKNLEEFYDLKNDPFELNNLINQTDYLNQIVDMRGQLDDWMEKINDLCYLTEQELVKVVAK